MKKSKEFYIGWRDKMPAEQKSFLFKRVMIIFFMIPIMAFIIVKSQRSFNNHYFKLGNVQEFTGIYHNSPVPILKLTQDQLPDGISNYMLLVGYGKHGAEGIISKIENIEGPLVGKKIRLQGTLIYGDGKSVLELTKKENSLLDIIEDSISVDFEIGERVSFTYRGEILDPKCYFGVMKPGEGKIHKSCAIRCISGGIPPIFRSTDEDGKKKFHIILGQRGQKINREILDFVGEDIVMEGEAFLESGWDVVYIDPGEIARN